MPCVIVKMHKSIELIALLFLSILAGVLSEYRRQQ